MSTATVDFKTAFDSVTADSASGNALREAALSGKLGLWTGALTAACVQACEARKLRASAKGHKLDLLPVSRSEYLGLDVVAFSAEGRRWRFPALIAELENRQDFDGIAYALWKVLAVRAGLRVVFCYRRETSQGAELVRQLQAEVVGGLGLKGRLTMEGETVVVVGTRAEAGTFPYGFFAWWRLNAETGRFERL